MNVTLDDNLLSVNANDSLFINNCSNSLKLFTILFISFFDCSVFTILSTFNLLIIAFNLSFNIISKFFSLISSPITISHLTSSSPILIFKSSNSSIQNTFLPKFKLILFDFSFQGLFLKLFPIKLILTPIPSSENKEVIVLQIISGSLE